MRRVASPSTWGRRRAGFLFFLATIGAKALVATALAAPAATPAAPRGGNADPELGRLAEQFLTHWFETRPQVATRLGLHTYDALLKPVTQASLAADAAWMHDFREKLAAVPREKLSFDRALDRDVLAARVDRELLDLEVIRPYQRNPSAYLDMVAGSIQSLLQRDFAPPCERVRSATRRLRQVPEVLRAARVNLSNPPHLYTEVAITQFEGALRFYRSVLPSLASGCRDPETQAALAEADTAAVRATEDFLSWLREDLLPRSNGEFALGRETYQRKLAADEMVTTPVDTLLAMAWRGLEAGEAAMERQAVLIAGPSATGPAGVRAAIDSIETDRPDSTELVSFVASELDKIRAFVREHDLLTVPEEEHLIVRETPVFSRGLSFASMDSPGVWERRATEAYYNVTPADPSWSAADQRDHLAFFNRWSSQIVSIHEALPGHYYHFLAAQRLSSRVRQAMPAGTTGEGWAHYCEQMMVEEGYGGDDPRYRFAQLLLAQRRIGRMIAGLSLHTQGWTYDQALQLFQDRCYMTPVTAAREARRGALDPTYLVYTLGKWKILELREEVRKRLGPRFRLKEFHDAFLRQGASPLPVVRAGLLHELDLQQGRGRSPRR